MSRGYNYSCLVIEFIVNFKTTQQTNEDIPQQQITNIHFHIMQM